MGQELPPDVRQIRPLAPRLPPPGPPRPKLTGYSPPDYVRFYESDPQDSDALATTWSARGQNAIVLYSEVEKGACLERRGQADEWVIILPERDAGATLEVDGGRHVIPGYSVTFVPPGDSRLTFASNGNGQSGCSPPCRRISRAVASTRRRTRLPHHNIPSFCPWPIPPGGLKVRTYSLDVP